MAGKTVIIDNLTRYINRTVFATARDPFQDALLHLEFLAAPDHVAELMVSRHAIAQADAVSRAVSVRSHSTLALQYLRQAQAGPTEVCFLPSYYAIVNLMKVYILFSDLHGALESNRHHGASYHPSSPTATAFPDDKITLKPDGTLGLFYSVLTGKSLPGDVTLAMGTIYPYVQDIGAEWELASNDKPRIVAIEHGLENEGGSRFATHTFVGPAAEGGVTLEHVPALAECTPHPDGSGTKFRGPPQPDTDDSATLPPVGIDRRFLYYPVAGHTVTAVMDCGILMPEEFPIALALYHLSSVSRYHPELYDSFRLSRFWPAMAATRDHAVHRFLLLTLSFARQTHLDFVQR